MRMTGVILFVKQAESDWSSSIVGTSQAAKAASHDRILDIAAARIAATASTAWLWPSS